MQTWIQPTTAPKQPDTADEAVQEVDQEPGDTGRTHTLPWMEVEGRRPTKRTISAIDVFSAVIVIGFLLTLVVALPLLLLTAR